MAQAGEGNCLLHGHVKDDDPSTVTGKKCFNESLAEQSVLACPEQSPGLPRRPMTHEFWQSKQHLARLEQRLQPLQLVLKLHDLLSLKLFRLSEIFLEGLITWGS